MSAIEKEVRHEMAIMDTTGDTKLIWDIDNDDEIEAARAMFEKLTEKKFLAYSVGRNGKKDELIKKFDPELEKIILVPPVVGG